MAKLGWSSVVVCMAIFISVPNRSRSETVPPTAYTQSLGACFWSHVTDEQKADFAAVYHKAVVDGLTAHTKDYAKWLSDKRVVLDAAFAQCDANPKIPRILSYGVIGAQFLQFGSSNELLATSQIMRAELDESWKTAPEATRQCFRAQAGMSLGGTDLTCPDTKVLSWFITDLRARHTLDSKRGDTLMVLTYMSAVARDEVAESKIAKFEKDQGPAATQ